MNWKQFGGKSLWSNSRYYPGMCLKGQKTTMKNLVKIASVPAKILTIHVLHMSGILLVEPTCFMFSTLYASLTIIWNLQHILRSTTLFISHSHHTKEFCVIYLHFKRHSIRNKGWVWVLTKSIIKASLSTTDQTWPSQFLTLPMNFFIHIIRLNSNHC